MSELDEYLLLLPHAHRRDSASKHFLIYLLLYAYQRSMYFVSNTQRMYDVQTAKPKYRK